MKKNWLSSFAAVVLVICMLAGFAACGKEKEKTNENTGITLHGIMVDSNGAFPVGYEVVFCSYDGEFYIGEVGKDGSFTVNGILPDEEHSLTVEDKSGNLFTEVSYFTMLTGDEVSLVNKGKNMFSYLNVNVTDTVKDLYITFCMDNESGYMDCKYVSAEGPQSAEAVTAKESEQVVGTTKENSVLF